MIFLENHGSGRNPKRRRAKSGVRSNSQGEAMASKRSRRKGAKRRKSRRAVAVVHHNAPRRAAKRRRRSSAHARRNAPRRAGRRGARRNPPGIVGAITGALVDGVSVTGGVVLQNNIVRYIPSLVPATMANAAMINGLIGDVAGIIAGAYTMHRVFGGDRARLIVAGQAHAAIARQLRVYNVPVISTSLGEYDPIRGASGMGTYSRGLITPRTAPALPAGRNNVQTLKGVGIYESGMSTSPGLF